MIRFTLRCSLAWLTLLVVATRAAAADPADLVRFVPPNAHAAIVVFPQRLKSAPVAEFAPFEMLTAAGLEHLGFDPMTLDKAVLVVARGEGPLPFQYGAVLRMTTPYVTGDVADRLVGRSIDLADGQGGYVEGEDGQMGVAIDGPRKNLMIGVEPLVGAMVQARDVQSPLVGMLRRVDDKTCLAVLITEDAVRQAQKQISQVTAQAPMLAQIPAVSSAIERVTATLSKLLEVELRVAADQSLTAHVRLRMKSAVDAAELERTLKAALVQAREQAKLLATTGSQMPSYLTDANAAYAARLTDGALRIVKIRRGSESVLVDIEATPEWSASFLFAQSFLPLVMPRGGASPGMGLPAPGMSFGPTNFEPGTETIGVDLPALDGEKPAEAEAPGAP